MTDAITLELHNVGNIRDARIEIDGITILTGVNGTGKSTVLKTIYSVLEASRDLENRRLSRIEGRLGSVRELWRDAFPVRRWDRNGIPVDVMGVFRRRVRTEESRGMTATSIGYIADADIEVRTGEAAVQNRNVRPPWRNSIMLKKFR